MMKEQLVTELMRFMTEFEGRVAKPAQLCARSTITGVQLQLLLLLQHYGPQKMTDLAYHKKISKPQLTTAVNGLVVQGLVTRESDEEDRRIVRIRCTQSGEQYLAGLKQQLIDGLSHSVQSLTEEEQQELYQAIHTAGNLIQKFHFPDPHDD